MIKTKDGLELYTLEREVDNPIAKLFIAHGYAEHIHRYEHFIDFLNTKQISVFGIDHRGHGRSDGEPAYIERFELYLEDMDLWLANHLNDDVPVFLFGHSMGGLIVASYIMDYPVRSEIKGVILSAPALMAQQDLAPLLIKFSSFLGKYLPKLRTISLDPTFVSSEPDVVEKYINDPLVYSGKWIARTGSELIRKMKEVQKKASSFTTPVFLGHGGSDKLAEIKGSQTFIENIASEDKIFKSYEGYFHEILNEAGKQVVMDDMLNWIKARI